MLARQERVRALARTRLTGGTRAVFDSEDVLSSVVRRLDSLVERGRLRVTSEDELWALITTIVLNDATSKSRLMERARAMSLDDQEFAQMLLRRAAACKQDEDADALVLQMAGSISGGDERQMLLLRLRGASHRAIAGALGISEVAARQRWSQLVRSLVERFGNTPEK